MASSPDSYPVSSPDSRRNRVGEHDAKPQGWSASAGVQLGRGVGRRDLSCLGDQAGLAVSGREFAIGRTEEAHPAVVVVARAVLGHGALVDHGRTVCCTYLCPTPEHPDGFLAGSGMIDSGEAILEVTVKPDSSVTFVLYRTPGDKSDAISATGPASLQVAGDGWATSLQAAPTPIGPVNLDAEWSCGG